MQLCRHVSVGWPVRLDKTKEARQRCLDCGRSRAYDVDRAIAGDWEIDGETPVKVHEFLLDAPSFLIGALMGFALYAGLLWVIHSGIRG